MKKVTFFRPFSLQSEPVMKNKRWLLLRHELMGCTAFPPNVSILAVQDCYGISVLGKAVVLRKGLQQWGTSHSRIYLEIVREIPCAHHALLASKLAKKASTIHGYSIG